MRNPSKHTYRSGSLGLIIDALGGLQPCRLASSTVLEQTENGEVHFSWFITQTDHYWPGRSRPLRADLVYKYARSSEAVCLSCSSYGLWRDDLARFAGYNTAKDARSAGLGPFIDLIDFTDCEGVIGSLSATKLSHEFKAYEAEASAFARSWEFHPRWAEGKWIKMYAEMSEVLAVAAEDGAVTFG